MKLNIHMVHNTIKNVFRIKKENRKDVKISDQVIKHSLLTEAIIKCPKNSKGYEDIDNIETYCMAHDRKYFTSWGDALTKGNPFINIYLTDKDKTGFNIEDLETASEMLFESGYITEERYSQLKELDEVIHSCKEK